MNEIIITGVLAGMFIASLYMFRLGYAWLLVFGTFINAAMFLFGLIQIDVFGFSLFVGTLIYGANFYITDLLEEYYGITKARSFVWIIVGTQVGLLTLGTLVVTLLPGSEDALMPFVQELLAPWYPLMLTAVIGNVILQYFDTWLYSYIKQRTGPKWLWLRNNGSTMTTMTLDAFVVIPVGIYLAFPEMSSTTLLSLVLSSALIKYIIALLDTPFIYLSRSCKPAELQKTEPM